MENGSNKMIETKGDRINVKEQRKKFNRNAGKKVYGSTDEIIVNHKMDFGIWPEEVKTCVGLEVVPTKTKRLLQK